MDRRILRILTAHPKEARMSNDQDKRKWTQPLSTTKWAAIFGIHRNTMRKWLRDQRIENEQISPRRWRIAPNDLPVEDVTPRIAQ